MPLDCIILHSCICHKKIYRRFDAATFVCLNFFSACCRLAKNNFLTNGSKLIMVAKRRQQVIEVLKIWYNYYCNFYHLFLVFYLFTFYWTKDNFLTFIIFCQMLFSFVLKRWLFLTKLSFKFKDFRGCFRRITINIF